MLKTRITDLARSLLYQLGDALQRCWDEFRSLQAAVLLFGVRGALRLVLADEFRRLENLEEREAAICAREQKLEARQAEVSELATEVTRLHGVYSELLRKESHGAETEPIADLPN